MIFAPTDGKRNPSASFSFEHSWKEKLQRTRWEKKINKKTDFKKIDLKSKPCAKGRNDSLNNNTQFRTISPGRKLIDPSSCKSDSNE